MRDVLVALCGLTPQVVTETLWALHHRTPPVDPAEVWILTTQAGRERCVRTLLGPRGALARFAKEYRPKPAPRCPTDHVVVFNDATGNPLEDVRSEQDNRLVADQAAAFLRRRTNEPDTRLHCSVAGGRKTMGALLAAALQIYGREEDRLYHVLVSEPFESCPAFFFPTKPPTWVTDKTGRRLRTSQAHIELADLPFVPLRGLLPVEILHHPRSFGDLVTMAGERLRRLSDPDPVRLDPKANRLWVGAKSLTLSPTAITLYRAFARIKLFHCVRQDLPHCGDCMECFLPFTKATWSDTKAVIEESGGGKILPSVKGPDDAPEQFRSLVSKLNKKLDTVLSLWGQNNPYRIRSAGQKGETTYGLALDKSKLSEG